MDKKTPNTKNFTTHNLIAQNFFVKLKLYQLQTSSKKKKTNKNKKYSMLDGEACTVCLQSVCLCERKKQRKRQNTNTIQSKWCKLNSHSQKHSHCIKILTQTQQTKNISNK